MQLAAGVAAAGQPSGGLASAARRRRGQRHLVVSRVVGRYAAGAGAVPPQPAAAAPPLPPAQQQAAQRPPVAPRRRVGVNLQPPTPIAPPGSNALQSLTAAAGGAASSFVKAPAPVQQPFTVDVRQAAALSSPAEVLLSRSQLVNKEVITRTSGRRLGYVQQMYVDPVSLAVKSLYLRRAANPIGANKGEEHILLSSLKQISDVILVHNEDALLDPIADDSVGFYPLVGSAVFTRDGQELGKVRDFVFDPDSGGIGTIKYDKLGIPTLPQQLFDCYSIGFSDIVAVGPNRVIVRAGTAQRAIKENDGLMNNLGNLLAIGVFGGKDGEEKRLAAAQGDSSFRLDEGYIRWYEQFGRASGMEPPGTPEYAAEQLEWKRARGLAGAAPQAPPARQQAPRALPPPQTATFAQAVQAQQVQQAQQAQQAASYQQQMFQPQRQAVPAGAAGWGAPPPAQQQAAAPPPPPPQYQQAYQAPPPAQQPYQAPPQQQPQTYQQPLAAAAPTQQPPVQQQQYRPSPATPQQPRPAAAAPPPQAAPAAQQPPIPQNGIPIIDRTPLPPYRRRDADGNYGKPPAQQPASVQQQASAQQQPLAPQRQPPPPAASATWGGSAPAQRAPQQPARMQQQAPVVVPDAVIIPGSVQRPTGGLGGGGAVGGPTRIAQYRQL